MIETLQDVQGSIKKKILICKIFDKFSKTHNFDDLLTNLENNNEAVK
jgi:hypothetical protein